MPNRFDLADFWWRGGGCIPAQRELFMCRTAAAKVGVWESFGTVGSSCVPHHTIVREATLALRTTQHIAQVCVGGGGTIMNAVKQTYGVAKLGLGGVGSVLAYHQILRFQRCNSPEQFHLAVEGGGINGALTSFLFELDL